jgi:DNA-binding transcriptional MerR regulator
VDEVLQHPTIATKGATMDIYDLAKATGLSRERILYYAEKGIIADRSWKIHREYFPEDVSRLKKAVLFRKMGFDIYAIPKILDDSVSLEQTLAEQLVLLEAEKDKFDGAYNLCAAMLCEIRTSGEGKSEHLDAVRWNEFIRREEAAGHTFVDCWQDFRTDLGFLTLFEPFFIKDLRKNRRSDILVGLLCVLAMVVVGLIVRESAFLVIPAFLAICSLSRCLLGKKHPRLARWLPDLLLIALLLIMVVIVGIAGIIR